MREGATEGGEGGPLREEREREWRVREVRGWGPALTAPWMS